MKPIMDGIANGLTFWAIIIILLFVVALIFY